MTRSVPDSHDGPATVESAGGTRAVAEPDSGARADATPAAAIRPGPDVLSAPFWAAAADHRLCLQRCRVCAHVNHPPQPLCGWCSSADLHFEQMAGDGRIASWTSELRSGSNRGAPPHTNLVVELSVQDGVYLVGSVAGPRPNWVRIGTPVEMYFESLPGLDDVVVPQFRPKDGS